MLILALDTALGACSAAVNDLAANRLLASKFQEMERGQAERLAPMVEEVLQNAGIKPADLQRIVVTNGPGTFTGLRIALSLARGMGTALGIPVVGIDTLTATAAPHFGGTNTVVVAHLSGGTEKYFATAFDGRTGRMMTPMALLAPTEVAALIEGQGKDLLLVGTGLDSIVALAPSILRVSRGNQPDVAGFAALASSIPVTGAMPEPLYLREPDAKPSVPQALSAPHVRPVVADDLATLAEIHALSFDKGWTEESLSSALSLPGAGVLAVEIAGTVYGFVQYQWVAGEAEINTICVAPNYRRQHLASCLLDGLVAVLRAKGTDRIFLEVAEGNIAARELYQRHGFALTGRRKAYYRRPDGTHEDALMMAASLPANAP